MEKLELAVINFYEPNCDSNPFEAVEFYVNGIELLDYLEIRQRNRGKSFDKTKYVGISPQWAFLPSQHLLGSSNDSECGLAAIYKCSGCGFFECDSIQVKITVREDTVEWSNFTLKHCYTEEDLRDARFLPIKPLVFIKADYETALRFHQAKKVAGYIKSGPSGLTYLDDY